MAKTIFIVEDNKEISDLLSSYLSDNKSLAGYQNPIGVAEWKNQIARSLPEELKSSLPTIEEIERALDE